MSNKTVSRIEKLPVELIHRIFDNLDAETIFISLRLVSRLFRSIVTTYDRYVFDFNLISKANFHVLCRSINPKRIISLSLSNNDRTVEQINLFISFDQLPQMTQIRSLTLYNVREDQLNIILNKINLNLLKEFSLRILKYDNKYTEATMNFLSSLIAQSTFRKLDIDMSKIVWPSNSAIQYLKIHEQIDIVNVYMILQCSPHLQTLIVHSCRMETIDNLTLKYFPNLKTLTINEFWTKIDNLESFLAMTPSLVYLKLIGKGQILNGERWEQFITRNLIQLDRFEFYFSEVKRKRQTNEDLQLIISSFQTPFWTEEKKWFVICECDAFCNEGLDLYSMPLCKPSLTYKASSRKISSSTYDVTTNENLLKTNNIKSLSLTLNESVAVEVEKKKTTAKHPMFPNVTETDVSFNIGWSLLSLQSLSIFINPSRIVCIKILNLEFIEYFEGIWENIGSIIEQMHNLSSLSMDNNFCTEHRHRTIKNISSILPRRLKHLEIVVDDVLQIKRILERCENLSIIIVKNVDKKFSDEVIKWFTENTISTTCKKIALGVSVWLGKKIIQRTKIYSNGKRNELTNIISSS